jgi:cytochrome c-type biogenesis protein CcmE
MRSRIRFILALTLAAVLGGWLLYVSLGGATETYTGPANLAASQQAPGETYRLNGLVSGAVPDDAVAQARSDSGYTFVVADKADPAATVTVVYRGTVPDQFKTGREIVVTGRMENGTFVAKRDSLLALCPSKFTAAETNIPGE